MHKTRLHVRLPHSRHFILYVNKYHQCRKCFQNAFGACAVLEPKYLAPLARKTTDGPAVFHYCAVTTEITGRLMHEEQTPGRSFANAPRFEDTWSPGSFR